MKTLDRLLITSFIPPFFMTFFIAIFVLIMQFLWTYIDDIIGKGVAIAVIFELLFYQSLALMPLALPIATLISSVMVMGGFGERYELASMKSAGISLMRTMAPLMVVTGLISVFSFCSANWIIPFANLQFKSRLYDIRKQKPMLSITEGAFNNDLSGFVMRIGKKDKDDQTIHDVLIYDHSGNRRNDKMVHAADGTMGYTADKRYLSMKLRNGESYEDVQSRGGRSANSFPFMRTSFKTYDILFDMEQFKFGETPKEQFGSHPTMRTTKQLLAGVDSLGQSRNRRLTLLKEYVVPYFYYRNPMNKGKFFTRIATPTPLPSRFIETIPMGNRSNVAGRANRLAGNLLEYARTTEEDLKLAKQNLREYWLEINLKISLAFACLMFLFIGAPMGAIIRKGGFGWPILVSILFFVSYMVVLIVGKKLAKEGEISAFLGCWLPNLILTPIGIVITYKALRDSALFNVDEYTRVLSKYWEIVAKRLGLGVK